MDDKDCIRQIGFDQIKGHKDVDYVDDDIVMHTDIRELPVENGSVQVNMFTIVACNRGKLQLELNALAYTIEQNEILVCLPNSIISNCMLSLDFEGAVLCMSHRSMLEQIPKNEIWDRMFRLAENPIMRVSAESLRMLNSYGSMLKEKLKMRQSPFYKEIVSLLVKALLYELLANVEQGSVFYEGRAITQRDILFKRFIELLSTTRIKPRDVSWYAEQLCVTPKYLSTVSKQESGKTAFDWINEYVLLDIRYWLKNSNKTIKEIAYMLNFPNISFFGKYCRTRVGMSPSKYRAQLRDITSE